ncbi:class II aldolase/adducin family protein [Lentzea sp. NPDC051213]|uniref:class II aldolase/adducin family protein n=1 Tax=Lentzea sp. NPDC051213 TaxID=3364126 RepID=UPI0037B13C32
MTNVFAAERPEFLADTKTGLPLSDEPQFGNVEEERLHRRRELAAAMRIFGKLGYGEGVSGHISVRDPEDPDLFWVNPFGVPFELVKVRDLICVDGNGAVVRGAGKVNPSAFVIHSKIHEMNPGAGAAAHGHTIYSRALGSLGRLLEPLDQESAAFYEGQVFYDEYEGPSMTVGQGEDIAGKLGDKRSILLRHHGLITVGETLGEAIHWFLTYENCAKVQLLAAAAGKPIPMTPRQARSARDGGFGDAGLGRFSFEMYYQTIVAEQPELLED